MKIVFCSVVFQVIMNNSIGAISTENGSNDISSSTLIFERPSNSVIRNVYQVSRHSYNNESLVAKMCDCKCNCCLQKTYSCEHFCVCVEDRTPILQSCLGDLNFNPDIENCDLLENFDCVYKTTSSIPSSTPTESSPIPTSTTSPDFPCTTEEGLFQYPGNCSLFIQCSNFLPNIHVCPTTLHFCESCVPPRCEYPTIANCTVEDGSKKNIIRKSRSIVMEKAVLVDGKSNYNGSKFKCPSKYGFYPVPANPRSFYKCLNGVPTAELKCPLGLVYNPARVSCSKI